MTPFPTFQLQNFINGPFFPENWMGLKKICQITILNLYFEITYFLFVLVDFQANATDISSKKGGKIQMKSLR